MGGDDTTIQGMTDQLGDTAAADTAAGDTGPADVTLSDTGPQHTATGARRVDGDWDPPAPVVPPDDLAEHEVTKPVASNTEPTPTSGDEFAVKARDEAVEARAQQYEEDGDPQAAQRVRDRLGGGGTPDGSGDAAPTI